MPPTFATPRESAIGATFGPTCRHATPRGLVPRVRAASTKSSRSTTFALACTTRAIPVQPVRPRTTTIEVRLAAPHKAPTVVTRSSGGNAKTTSSARRRTNAIGRAPKRRATAVATPNTVPKTTEIVPAAAARVSDVRAPLASRARTSR
jgi:hypothetical protein